MAHTTDCSDFVLSIERSCGHVFARSEAILAPVVSELNRTFHPDDSWCPGSLASRMAGRTYWVFERMARKRVHIEVASAYADDKQNGCVVGT